MILQCSACGTRFELTRCDTDNRKFCSNGCRGSHGYTYEDLTAEPLEEVLAGGPRSTRVHIPKPDVDTDEPLCGRVRFQGHDTDRDGGGWRRRDRRVFPNRDECSECVERLFPPAEVIES